MGFDLVIDIGNVRIKGGLFEEDTLVYNFSLIAFPFSKEKFISHISGKTIQRAFISSVNNQLEMHVKTTLAEASVPCEFLNYTLLQLKLEIEKPEELGHDRIANAYGALFRFPVNDCIILDIGSVITCDLVAKDGRYLGGMIYPGPEMCAKALTGHTDKLPLVSTIKPLSPWHYNGNAYPKRHLLWTTGSHGKAHRRSCRYHFISKFCQNHCYRRCNTHRKPPSIRRKSRICRRFKRTCRLY